MAQKAGYSSLGSERPTAATSAPPGPDEGPVASTSSGAVHENTGKRVDRYLYASYAFLGCGILFPWNAIITATDFFYALYPAQHVDRLFPIAYFFPNVAVLLLLNLFPDTCRGVLSQRSRVLAGYSSFLFALLTITVAGGACSGPSTGSASSTLAIIVASVGLVGAADGLAQGSLFAEVGCMPPAYTQALMAGTSVSGVAISLLRMVTKASFPATPAGLFRSTILYFSVSAACVAACIASYVALQRHPVVRLYSQARSRSCGSHPGEEGAAGGVLPEEESGTLPLRAAADEASGPAEHVPASSSHELRLAGKEEWAHLRRLHAPHLGLPYFLSIFLVYVVTLAIFPGFLAEDVASPALGDWYPVLLIAIFNVGDLRGKAAPAFAPGRVAAVPPTWLLGAVVSRALFIPAYLLCTLGPARLRGEGPIVVLTLALGLTSGLYASVAMINGPGASKKEGESLAAAMVLYLILGLATGAACGWLWLL